MQYKEYEIKKGIKVHTIKTEKFKTNIVSAFLTTELNKENVTKNAVISSILRRGSMELKTQEEINKKMEEMYGASFDCGLDKTGDNQIIKFYIETVNDKYLPEKSENILKNSIECLLNIIFNPYIENKKFKEEYLEQEKNNIKHLIEGKIDNKRAYALERCIEEVYKNKPYGLYKFGYLEDLEKINSQNLYEYYKNLINNCKIDIFISGNIEEDIIEFIKNNSNIKTLNEREPKYIKPNYINKKLPESENVVIEKKDVTQGKLILGLDVNIKNTNSRYAVLMYNSLLGGTPNSKMFQNVREKSHLAYVASSSYMRYKSNIFIICGIDIENYEKTLKLIKEQIEEMEQGKFTDEDIKDAKKGIIASIKTIDDEQDTGIAYYFGQDLSEEYYTTEEYISNIEKIEKKDIIEIAKNVKINTIYFLTNNKPSSCEN